MVAVSIKSKLQPMKSSARLLIERPLSEAELLSRAGEAERRLVASFGTEARRREALMWRMMVRRELHVDAQIVYDENGAPQVVNREEYIGVSHSADFVAVVISPSRCAVDIERLDRNFERVAPRYMRPEERTLSADERLAAVVWCAKETLYKFSGRRALDFLTDIKILAVNLEEGSVVGQIKDNEPVKMLLKFHSGNAVVYIGEF